MINRLKSLRNTPAKWHRRSMVERAMLVEAFFLLGIARLMLLSLPFKWIAITLGSHMNVADTHLKPSEFRCARIVGQAVCSAARYTLWESVCLPQAIVAKWMLRLRHIDSTLYLGVAKNKTSPDKLTAHAWLRSGNSILTGREGHRDFTVVATFS